jgi:hypothetical protein
MNTLPPRLLVYGIEGANFTAGVDISPLVKESASQVIDQIIEDFKVNKEVLPVVKNRMFQHNNL